MYELIEKKSRFIGYAATVSSETEAKNFIDGIACEHKRTQHIAFAYIVPGATRFSDAGEPRGTAGLPLFNSIYRRGLENTVVVVVRYYGGIHLGKGGLMRAYGKTAGGALDSIL